jgi:hypothetical protein
MKNYFIHGLIAGVLAACASTVHNYSYSKAFDSDYNAVVNVGSIISASIAACLLASLGYYFFKKMLPSKAMLGDLLFSVLFLVVTFSSFLSPYLITLPEAIDVDAQLLFAGLVLPMHIFPILFWFVTKGFVHK